MECSENTAVMMLNILTMSISKAIFRINVNILLIYSGSQFN